MIIGNARVPSQETFTGLFVLCECKFVARVSDSKFVSRGKTGVTADRDKIEFRLFNSSSIFNITLREELFSWSDGRP